jgi:predicted PurR-regulated permease PerM
MPVEKGNRLELSWASIWRVAAVLLLLALLYLVQNVVVAVLLAIVISSAFDPIVSFLEKKRIPRVLGTLALYILIITAFALVFYTIVPLALSELNVLIENLTEINIPFLGLDQFSDVVRNLNESIGRLANLLISGSASVFDTLARFVGGVTLALAVFILSFYLTVDRDGVEKFLQAILPSSSEDVVLDIYFRTRQKIGKWLQGQVFLSLSVGFSVFIALWLLGIRYSLILGILAGLLEIVPFVGPIFSGAVAFLIALSQSTSAAIYVLILFTVIQQLESYLLTPTFMRLTTGLNPPLILISLLIGSQLLGFVGLVLAVPAAVLVQEVINYWSSSKQKRKAALLNV